MLLEKLYSFVSIIENGSYKAAASEIHLSQPAITHHIKSLEEHYRVQLFHLSPKKPTPTAAGRGLYKQTKHVLSAMSDLNEVMKEFQTTKERITFCATSTVSTYLLPKILGGFKKANPDVSLNFKVGNSKYVENLLIEGKLDFGILGKVGSLARRFQKVPFHKETLKFVCSPDNKLATKTRVSLKDLKDYPFLMREDGTHVRSLFDEWSKKSSFKVTHYYEFGHMETVKHAVEQDLGISVLPLIAIQDEVDHNRLHILDIKGFNLKTSYYLVFQPKRYLSDASVKLLHCLIPDLKLN